MVCPQCGQNRCACGSRARSREADATSFSSNSHRILVDPEIWDNSEEQFEDSLISSAQPEQYRSIPLGHSYQNAREPNTRKTEIPDVSALVTDVQRQTAEPNAHAAAPDWRDAVANKLDCYRDKRGRKQLSGNYTMRLDFERSARRAAFATAAAIAPAVEVYPEHESAPSVSAWQEQDAGAVKPGLVDLGTPTAAEASVAVQNETVVPEQVAEPVPPKPKRERRIIEFPRLFAAEPQTSAPNELAESVIDRPRILDVPEETEQIELPLGGISFDAANDKEERAAAAREIDLPLQVAAVSQRFFAALVDWTVVLIATAVFAGIVLNIAADLPHNKLTLAFGLLAPCLFWATYQYLFLVHAAKTPGMLMAQLRMAAFDGKPTNSHVRRARALAMMVSCASAGLGFGWAFVDEDTLCWHDKISRTYVTNSIHERN